MTDLFPGAGRVLDAALSTVVGSRLLTGSLLRSDTARLRRMERCGRILVVGDLNIGDAVNLQAAVAGLRDFFPDAEIDYMISRKAECLVAGAPDISNLWPVFSGTHVPGEDDLRAIRDIAARVRYDLVFNFCPLFSLRKILTDHPTVVDYLTIATMFVRGEREGEGCNHVLYRTHRFIHDLFSPFMRPRAERPFSGVSVTLSDGAIREAAAFRESMNGPAAFPVVMYNPDASSRYTCMPAEFQTQLVDRILRHPCRLLLGAGHRMAGIEERILASLPYADRGRVTVVPGSLPLDAYAALADSADVYVTGDTGPLHIAAARKAARSGVPVFRNRTAVISLFGATSAHMYGYDSSKEGYFPSNQDAPSAVFAGNARCRNLTCVNKMEKTCRRVRCFDGLDPDRIGDAVAAFLPAPAQPRVQGVRPGEGPPINC